MKKDLHHSIRRAAAAALALLLLLTQGLAFAGTGDQPIDIILNLTRPDGTPETLSAMPAGYPGYEDAYWLHVSPEAQNDPGASLSLLDLLGQFPGGFSIPEGTPVSQFQPYDAMNSLEGPYVEVQGLGANGETLAIFRLFLSWSAPMPDEPAAEIQPADVLIRYLDQDGGEIASEVRTLPAGQHSVSPGAGLVPGDYQLSGQGEYSVTVDENGANPSEITFTYQLQIQPAQVTIRYLDGQGSPVASPQTQTLEPGTHDVYAQPSDLMANYTLTGPDVQTVTVDANGANPSAVTFIYMAMATEPPVQPAQVTIQYLDAQGSPVASPQTQTLEPGTHDVYAQPADLMANYTLTGPDVQTVTVDANGANPSVVTFTYMAAATEPPVQSAQVTIQYLDAQGSPVASPQIRMLEPGTHDVFAQPSDLMANYTLTGTDVQTVTVDQDGASPSVVIFTYMAAATEPPVQPAQIQVLYLDEAGNTVASAQILTLQPGTHQVTPTPADLLPGYELAGQGGFTVTVDASGASPGELTFVYRLIPQVSEPVNVTLSYVDTQGNKVASDTIFTAYEGQNPVAPQPLDLMAGYMLAAGEEIKYVTVKDNLATPAGLTFVYQQSETVTASPPPAPKVALISVVYRSESGVILFSETVPGKEGEETLIAADLSRVNAAEYQLVGEASYVITVDAQGVPSLGEVVFLFRDTTVRTAQITLHYRDEAGNPVSPSQTMEITAGTAQIQANPEALPAGMELISMSPVAVTLSDSGVLSQNEVLFVYRQAEAATEAPVTPSPEPTILPFDLTTMDRYAYPTGDNINFRSSPDASQGGNVISVLSKQSLAHILGSVRNSQGETWYLADVDGREGFLKESVVRLLSYEETAALFNWTPTPAPAPTPETEAVQDGEVIDRWAEVSDSKGVNFRTQASTSSTLITKLDRGERVWVYTQQTVGSTVWFHVMANGRKGYVVAEYTRLYTTQESAQYQASLPTPMPYSTTPTPGQPAVTATPVPQATTAVPVNQTPQPSVYHGYALTTRQSALRTGASQVDEPILEMLEVNTLVYVWGQTFIGADGWSNVQVLADKVYGYLPNSSLRYITEQEAVPYLNLLQPQATPTPQPTQQPAQRTGYAITLGENVPMRAFADTNAQILNLLPDSSVVAVRGQEFTSGSVWHLVQYGAGYGFVRADQLRLLSADEEAAYLQSLRTPTPAPVATLPPVTLNSPSSYGYVNTNAVRLRSGPTSGSRELKLMGRHAFALIYGSSVQTDGIWYHISQGGTVGYVKGDFFTVLPMGELSTYLQSAEYLNANSASIPSLNGYQQSANITPVEDFNNTVWQNPSLINASYEPFNPLGTATPSVEAIFTPTPLASATPSPEPLVIEGFEDPPEKADSNFPTGLLAVGLVALLGGGGYYAYHLYNQNQKRAAQRAAQRRAEMAKQAGQPQARSAQQQPVSPYAPPRPGMQGSAPYQPGAAPPIQPGQTPQGTAQYRPGMTPPTQPGQTPQGTAQYRPGMTPPTQPGQTPQGTAQYRPGMTPPLQPGQTAQGTASYKPAGTQPLQPGQTQGTTQQSANPQNKPEGSDSQQANESRRRRSERRDKS